MIYVCIPAHNDAKTVGLLLWKIRQVFSAFPREYHLVVADDGSTDGTAEVLDRYLRALPLTALHHDSPLGQAATIEHLLAHVLDLTDRPKRDCVVTFTADFAISPAAIPDLVKRFESGADLVIAESIEADPSPSRRLIRRVAGWLLRPGIHIPGVSDLLSGVSAIRLVTLKRCMREQSGDLLTSDGICATAELVARAAAHARQISAVPIAAEHLRPEIARIRGSVPLALELFRVGRRLHIPQPEAQVQRVA